MEGKDGESTIIDGNEGDSTTVADDAVDEDRESSGTAASREGPAAGLRSTTAGGFRSMTPGGALSITPVDLRSMTAGDTGILGDERPVLLTGVAASESGDDGFSLPACDIATLNREVGVGRSRGMSFSGLTGIVPVG